jgi:hypothetical protein
VPAASFRAADRQSTRVSPSLLWKKSAGLSSCKRLLKEENPQTVVGGQGSATSILRQE